MSERKALKRTLRALVLLHIITMVGSLIWVIWQPENPLPLKVGGTALCTLCLTIFIGLTLDRD